MFEGQGKVFLSLVAPPIDRDNFAAASASAAAGWFSESMLAFQLTFFTKDISVFNNGEKGEFLG